MQELRQSTEVKVRVGAFVDVGDGFTPETGITLGAADEAELLKHNGAATTDISGATWAAITGPDAWYDLTLTVNHTNTLGQLSVVVQDDSVCLPVFRDFVVVTQNYWDSKYSTDKLQVDATQIEGSDATDQITAAANASLVAYNLDHLAKTATAAPDMTTEVADNTIFSRMLANGDTSAFDPSSDGLQPIRDRGDSAWITATSVALSAAGQQDIAQLLNTRDTWFVNKSGNDSNSGTSWDDAFLTCGQAVSSASAGDKICIGPGTFTEQVDASAKVNLEFVGAGLATILTSADTITLQIGAGTIVRSMKIESTGTGSSCTALYSTFDDDIYLKDLVLLGEYNGALIAFSDRLRITNCYIRGGFIGIDLDGESNWIIRDSIIETTGTYGTGSNIQAIYTGANAGNGAMYGGQLISTRNDVSAKAAVAFGVNSSIQSGKFLLDHVQIIAEHQNAGATGVVCGVAEGDGTGIRNKITLVACSIYTNQAGGGNEYDLNQSTGILAVDASTLYDTTKTNGTITNLGQDASDLALVANNLDHLMKTAVGNNADMTTEVPDGTVLSNLMSATSDTSTFVVADDSLQGISEGAAGGGASAAEVWDYSIPASPNANTAADYLQVMDAVVGGVTNTDTTNEVAFKNRSGTERIRITFGSDDGSRTASVIS